METPIELELMGKKNNMYALKYPGLQIPIHVNLELLEKFKKSPDYIVREAALFSKNKGQPWFDDFSPDQLGAQN